MFECLSLILNTTETDQFSVFYVWPLVSDMSHFIFPVGHKGQTHGGFICLWSREVAVFKCIIYFMTKVLIHYMKFLIGPLLVNQCQNWEFNTTSASRTNETDRPTIFLWHIPVDTLCNMAVELKLRYKCKIQSFIHFIWMRSNEQWNKCTEIFAALPTIINRERARYYY